MTTTATQYCITGTLAPQAAWGTTALDQKRSIMHLFRRMTFGASLTDINWALTQTPSQVVDTLVDLAVGETNVPAPGLNIHKWADKRPWLDNDMLNTCNDFNNRLGALRVEWLNGMIGNHNASDTIPNQNIDRAKRFKYKMAFFWHDHFPTDRRTYNGVVGTMWYKYNLIYNAVGNFKTFVKDIGRDHSMLEYLNGNINWYQPPSINPNWEPNENYARELLELFVMGAATGNDPTDYTQQDIEELSRVFTGWRAEYWSPTPTKFREYIFQPNLHDWTSKTIFGITVTPTMPPAGVNMTINNYDDIAWPETDTSIPMLYCNNQVSPPVVEQLHYLINGVLTPQYGFRELCNHTNGRVYCGTENAFGIAEASAEYNEVHDIIFGEHNGSVISAARQMRIARHICGKIYKYFLYSGVDESDSDYITIIDQLATTFVNNNWELAPVLKQLFKSEHFFSAAARGAQIQSHLGAFYNLYSSLGTEHNVDYFSHPRFFDSQYDPNDPYGYIQWHVAPVEPSNTSAWGAIWHYVREMGHVLFEPPNVAGWTGYRTWINEHSFYKLGDELADCIATQFNDVRTPTLERARQLMINLSGNSSNPDVVAQAVAEHFIIVDLLPYQLAGAICAFKSEIPSNHLPIWNLSYDINPPILGTADEGIIIAKQFIALMQYLLRIPENYMT